MKKYLLLFPVLILCTGRLSAEQVSIDFTGTLQKNTSYSFNIRTTQTRNCEMKLLKLKHYPIRRDTQEIFCKGELFFRPDDAADGRTLRNVYDLKLVSLYGTLNSVRHDFPNLSGRTVRITVEAGKAEFQLIAERNKWAFDSVLGGPANNNAKDQNVLTPEALRMLGALFSPLSDPVSNYMGRTRKMTPRKHVKMNTTPIVAALRQRGIPANNAMIKSFAEYAGSTTIDRIPVHRVNLIAQGDGIPGYDFKFELSLMIPAQKKDARHGPLRVSRRTMEVVSTLLPESNPFFGGMTLETVSNDMTDLFIIPQ